MSKPAKPSTDEPGAVVQLGRLQDGLLKAARDLKTGRAGRRQARERDEAVKPPRRRKATR